MIRDEQVAQHKGPIDGIRQAPHEASHEDGETSIMEGDVVKELALKVLQVLLFSWAQLQRSEFYPATVYIMESKIMQGRVPMPIDPHNYNSHASKRKCSFFYSC